MNKVKKLAEAFGLDDKDAKELHRRLEARKNLEKMVGPVTVAPRPALLAWNIHLTFRNGLPQGWKK